MRLSIFRSVSHSTYPEEMLAYLYAFQPIPADELTRDGLLLSWTNDSGQEPYAVVEIPDGSLVTHENGAWQVYVPDIPFGIVAEHIYEVALEHSFGLTVVQGPPCIEDAVVTSEREEWWPMI